jgi:RNA polymerase sigma factor (sigma-70 family)
MMLEDLVIKAKNGDRNALEELLESIRDRLYNLSVRMLWHPQDAEDATQEILIRIFTHLGTFRGDSSFQTWIYRVASNYLLTTRKRRMEKLELSFDAFAEDLDRGLVGAPVSVNPELEKSLLAEEVKVGCTHGMLLCLDRPHRLAYILGEILELNGRESASILEVSPDTFRKRLSRARRTVADFMNRKCGIVNPDNPCRCAKRIRYAMETGRVNPDKLLFAGAYLVIPKTVRKEVKRLGELRDAATLLRNHPNYRSPENLREAILKLLK